MTRTRSDPSRPVVPAHGGTGSPSPWIVRWLPLVRAGGRVLDFASGHGRHARLARAAGHAVLAVDRDASVLGSMQGTGVEFRQEDLEGGRWSFAAERFDGIVCTNYLFRPRLDLMAELLAPGGVWLYETFAQGQQAWGRPTNPDFLLRPGELARLAQRARLHLLAYEDGVAGGERPARVQRMVAVRAPRAPGTLALR